jgi:hypothetical protein
LIKSATSFAFNRHVKVRSEQGPFSMTVTDRSYIGRYHGRYCRRCRESQSKSWGLHECT